MRPFPVISPAVVPLRLAFLVLAFAIAGPLGGCAVPRPSPESRPADFALAMTVYEVRRGSAGSESASGAVMEDEDADLRPIGAAGSGSAPIEPAQIPGQRYLIEPDGVLRAGFGPGASTHPYPPFVRELSRAQLDAVYEAARASGLLDLGEPDPPASPATHDEDTSRELRVPVALVHIASDGRRRTLEAVVGPLTARVPEGREPPASAEALRSLLARLSYRDDLAMLARVRPTRSPLSSNLPYEPQREPEQPQPDEQAEQPGE